MTYLITGAFGFVGRFLVEYLLDTKKDIYIVGTSRKSITEIRDARFYFEQIDLNEKGHITKLITKHQPSYIIHLAAESSVGFSWKYPTISFNNNVNIYLNLLEAVRHTNNKCRILSVGSSECYGIVAEKELPLKETNQLNPVSPYAVARVAQEMLSKVYIDGFGLDIVMTRSFNHIGPKQDARFVVPSFAKQILDRQKNKSKEPIETGNLSIIRDFLDVRDVVKAYDLLLAQGETGEVYNICSGEGHSLASIIMMISNIVNFSVETQVNPSYIRPNDNPKIVGDNSKIIKKTGWINHYNIQKSLEDIIYQQVKLNS